MTITPINDRNLQASLNSSNLLLGAASLLLSGAALLLPGNVPKVVSGIGSMLGFGYLSAQERKRQPMLEQIRDLETIELNAAKQKMLLQTHDFTLLNGQPETESKSKNKAPGYKTIQPREVFENSPHICILASSGSGKSVFTRWILNQFLASESVLLIDPHSSEGLTVESREHGINLLAQLREGTIKRLVVGHGRDYQSIYHIYLALENELGDRFANGGEGANHPFLNVVVEELPSLFDGVDEIDKGLVGRVNKAYLKEARKVNLRLLVISQGSEVGLLGLKGASSLKSGYTFVRLGKEAIRYAASKGNEDLETVLTDDFYKSLALHKKRKSPATFKGTCWLVDDDNYLPFKDISIWNDPILSDLLDPQFEDVQADESQPETTNQAPNVDNGSDRVEGTETLKSWSVSANSMGLGIPRDNSTEAPKPLLARIAIGLGLLPQTFQAIAVAWA